MNITIPLFVVISWLCVPASLSSGRQSDTPCEWCGAGEGPLVLTWEDTIATAEEPGERLVVSGTVFHADGVSPASDVVLYFYHTNAKETGGTEW